MNSQCGLIRLHNKGVKYATFSCRIAFSLRFKSTIYAWRGGEDELCYLIKSMGNPTPQ